MKRLFSLGMRQDVAGQEIEATERAVAQPVQQLIRRGSTALSMNRKSKDQSKLASESSREAVAEQLRKSEETAKEVAELCAQAADAARQHNLPHAGVGSTTSDHTSTGNTWAVNTR